MSIQAEVVGTRGQNQRMSSASEIMEYAGRVADLAQDVSNRASDRLHPVMSEPTPDPPQVDKEVPQNLAPLFHEIKGSLSRIEMSINNINYSLDRCEL